MGNEPLLVLPARRINDIKDEKYVVIMKVYKREKEVLDVLEEKGFNYVMVRKAGREGQVVTSSREEILSECEYMSLIIANR
ncbi:cobalt-precorrin-2 C(20)-methyltransferase [compost metagenome]